MHVRCVSRGTQSGGKELAELLAAKLDYACLGREELNEAATREGIQVGKLEMAMVRPGIFSERLALERDHYLAFTTAYLCDKAVEGGLVYHGRTGHLVLPGVSHVLKARVLADPEYRIRAVMRDLGLERAKARRYIEDVDEDRRRWERSMYAVSWEDAANYDLVLNLTQVSMENAATVLMNMAQLPDFQMTPASRTSMEDLRLAAKARTMLAQDERTHEVENLIEDTLRLATNQIKLAKVKVKGDLAPNLPPVYGDRRQLEQVFLNIVLNALDAMPNGGTLTIDCSNTRDRELVAVAFRDTGIGIPEQKISDVFNPFFTTKPDAKGTGLGLSVSLGIVRQHGGDIEVKSEVGKGTTFTVLLPVAKVPAEISADD